MDIRCNGIGGFIAWSVVLLIIGFALDIPFPRLGRLTKLAIIFVFGYCIFFYVMR